MATYRLLDGKHQQDCPVLDADGNPKKDADGKEVKEPRTFKKGDVFESDSDLLKLNQPGAIKFQLVGEGAKEGRIAQGKSPNDPTPKASNKAPGGQVSQGVQYVSGTDVYTGPSAPIGRDFPMPAQDFLPKPELAPELVDKSAEGEKGDTTKNPPTPSRRVHSGIPTPGEVYRSGAGGKGGTGLPAAGGSEAGTASPNPANKDMK